MSLELLSSFYYDSFIQQLFVQHLLRIVHSSMPWGSKSMLPIGKTLHLVYTFKFSSWTTDGKFTFQNGLKDVRKPLINQVCDDQTRLPKAIQICKVDLHSEEDESMFKWENMVKECFPKCVTLLT